MSKEDLILQEIKDLRAERKDAVQMIINMNKNVFTMNESLANIKVDQRLLVQELHGSKDGQGNTGFIKQTVETFKKHRDVLDKHNIAIVSASAVIGFIMFMISN